MRVTLPKLLALGFCVPLAGYVFMGAPRMHAAAARHVARVAVQPSPTAPAVPVQANSPAFPSAGHKFIGIMTNSGPYDYTDLDKFTSAVGHQPSVYEFGQGCPAPATPHPSTPAPKKPTLTPSPIISLP